MSPSDACLYISVVKSLHLQDTPLPVTPPSPAAWNPLGYRNRGRRHILFDGVLPGKSLRPMSLLEWRPGKNLFLAIAFPGQAVLQRCSLTFVEQGYLSPALEFSFSWALVGPTTPLYNEGSRKTVFGWL